MRPAVVISDLYSLLCIFALLLMPAGAYGWLGLGETSPSNVFAIILAMPWSLALRWVGDENGWMAFVLLACCMVLNVFIIRLLGRWWHDRGMKPE